MNKKFSTRYYLNLVLVDEENRRYFKQQEITIYRIQDDSEEWGFYFLLDLYYSNTYTCNRYGEYAGNASAAGLSTYTGPEL